MRSSTVAPQAVTDTFPLAALSFFSFFFLYFYSVTFFSSLFFSSCYFSFSELKKIFQKNQWGERLHSSPVIYLKYIMMTNVQVVMIKIHVQNLHVKIQGIINNLTLQEPKSIFSNFFKPKLSIQLNFQQYFILVVQVSQPSPWSKKINKFVFYQLSKNTQV